MINFGSKEGGNSRASSPAIVSGSGLFSFRISPLAILLTLSLLTLFTSALADPDYKGRLFYGLDPVITATDNPRLLGVERLVMRARLLKVGVDPLKDQGKNPELIDSFRQVWLTEYSVDLERKERLVEYNRMMGIVTTIEYPKFFYLFPVPETLPGGIIYYPPRPMGDPVVKLFVDDIEAGGARTRAVDRILVRDQLLGGNRVGKANQDDGLINLTIPIKLPRTLEKIIGRGEKTRIKITGRERISISGESTVVDPFIPSERISKQSLFPSLDMEQELQVNLSGVIGEKIIIEVDHNSAAIGPDATKIKLMYQGDEDEVIKTIETGDVGLTLPGSRLLGYSSNKSGLFGIKVTGQVGRADFTTVVSKQKAESSSKTFNSKGGEVEDITILSGNYLNQRFFRLDLPASPFYPVADFPGYSDTLKIDPASIKIYKMMGIGPEGARDVRNVATYVDPTGVFWNTADSPDQDFQDPFTYATRWREQDFDLMLDVDGNLVALDMRYSMLNEDVLAVVFTVVNELGVVQYKIGDRPGIDEASRISLPNEDQEYYRMKLLKAPVNQKEPYTFYYVLRNIYSLGGGSIDIDTFELRIERNETSVNFPYQDENQIPYIEIFGLDQNNPQNTGVPDGLVDSTEGAIFDLRKGLLKFPLDFPTPFNSDFETYERYSSGMAWDAPDENSEDSFLKRNQHSELYDPEILPSDYHNYNSFRFVASHAATASSFNLGVSNIEEGSEVVTLDGRTLVNGVDYEIDYTFGQIELKGDAANLTADSQVAVTYQYAPFFGGGQTNLIGLNVNYDLGRESTLSTTWLYQSESIVGEKAKLGEEPSKTLVGNMLLGHTFKPYFLTHVANFLSLRNTERESSIQFNVEAAVSLPNPNTKGSVYLEDFEGVDDSDIIGLTRTGWARGSQPFQGERYTMQNPGDSRQFLPESRVDNVRWFIPKERTERYMLNPALVNQERGETQQVMDLYLRDDDGAWDPENWGGITRGISRTGQDFSKAQFIEIWVNDGVPEMDQRSGKLHLDFGYINEDGFWPRAVLDDPDSRIIGQHEMEDGIVEGTEADGVFSFEEDIGLDGFGENGPQRYDASYEIDGDSPYPFINGSAKNSREDNEDVNRSGSLERDDGYFTTVIDLKDTEALVDVVYDYESSHPGDVGDLRDANIAWRKYRIRVGDIDTVSIGIQPNIQAITHTRIWFEDDSPNFQADPVHLQLSEFKFLGSRWEREGVRLSEGDVLLTPGERLPGEEFFLGEVNNKENPDYTSPFSVHEVQNIPEKEQSLVLDYGNLQQGHMVRASKQVSPRGDDYTSYREMSWYWYNPKASQAEIDLYFRVGSDTLNYYEVNYNFADSAKLTGWKNMSVDIAELANVKNGEVDLEGNTHGTIQDTRTSDMYDVRVVGRPDLRLVRRYYWVVANNELSEEASGYFYMNDVKLEGVKTDMGLAQSAGVRLNMADVFKLDFDWSKTDAEFHGLDKRTGSGQTAEDWNVSTNLNVNDFIPMAGFKLPISGSRRQSVVRPKYETNSDIEILDDDTRNKLSEIETQERFSARLNKAPSKGAIPRYLIDPWVILANGSRSSRRGPLDERDQKSLSGSVNYDLRISGNYHLGDYPVLGSIPLVKGLNFVPSKVAMGASFSSTYSSSRTINEDGSINQRPTTKTRPATLTANLEYDPLDIINLSVGGVSERDLLRESLKYGVNLGAENKRLYDLRMTITPPMAKSFPDGKLFYPFRAAARGLKSLKPSVQFTGSFVDDHNPNIAQPGDPTGTRSISNSNRWDIRMSLPMGKLFKSVVPEKKYDAAAKKRIIEEERRKAQREMRRGTAQSQFPAEWADLPPDERARLEEEFLLEQAEERMAEEQSQGLNKQDSVAEDSGPGFNLTSVYNAFFDPFRKIKPIKITYSEDRSSAYGRIYTDVSAWYKAAFQTELDVPDSTYVSHGFQSRQSINVSTSTQLARTISLDVKYNQKLSDRVQVSSSSRGYQQDWPDASLAFSGLEKWRIFGGGGQELDSGWFRSSNINFSYKHSKTVNNITPISYNPSTSTTISPRWSFTFHSGLNATLTTTIGNDYSENNGVITENNKLRVGVQVRHQFKAQSFLAKIGLYKPGSNPSINMDVDISFSQDSSERFNPGSLTSTPTGQTRYGVNPRFSYQVTRNLSGALTFTFSRSKDLATNLTTTSLGLGVEATFVF